MRRTLISMSRAQQLRWRSDLVWGRMAGRYPHVPWGLLAREIARAHKPCRHRETVRILERDDAAGMVYLAVGEDHRFWFPAQANFEPLGSSYGEVFDPGHNHYYEWREARLRPDDVALDAGACEGYFTRFALDRGARVLAVEPWSLMARCLERTFAPEIAQGRIEIARVFLGRETGEATFAVYLANPFAAAAADADNCPDGSGDPAAGVVRENVRVETLDNLVSASSFKRLDFVKMDIEGAERDALAGGAQTFRRFRPRAGITTYHRADDWRDITRQLRAFVPGYRFHLKGVGHYDSDGWRPILLHAWPAVIKTAKAAIKATP